MVQGYFVVMKVKTRILVFSLLLLLYAVYSAKIYISDEGSQITGNTDAAVQGKMLWQKHNCQSCHQLYGLGGYLGPDLTNCFSAPHKGPAYMDAVLQYGNGIMPDFKLTANERARIIAFLEQVDKSGQADPKKFITTITGNIHPHATE